MNTLSRLSYPPLGTLRRPSLPVALLFILLSFGVRHSAQGAVIYSGLQNIAIPTTFDGVYLDIDNGHISTSTILGWDVNFFFGGVGIAASTGFQPARMSTSNESTVLKYALNDAIDGSLNYAGAQETGSGDHLGMAGNFQNGVQGYLGFKFTKNNSSGPYYGWMRVTLTANTSGALIHDWAWEDSGAFILAGAMVPEPGRALMILAGLAVACLRRKRGPGPIAQTRVPAGGTHL